MRRHNRTGTKVWWWKFQISTKSNMADGRHFENRYSYITQPQIVRIWRNLVFRRKYWARGRKRGKNSEIPKFKMADGRHTENHFFGYNSAPYCPIKTIFGNRRHNRTHTKVRWWKCQISKIQHGGRPPFWKSLYLHISAANCPNFTKLSMGTQILSQATETWQRNQKFPSSRWRTDAILKITFCL